MNASLFYDIFYIVCFVGAAIIFIEIARQMDQHERWLKRQDLRSETWAKIKALPPHRWES